ncbi:MAG TPA: DUF1501 domain-containing protein, partial [Planctomycetaceae bacterium]|nr:DUF1501 domain-containing protein [Planctomycetaceae bacterium]
MLTIRGIPSARNCDGVTRRSFLQAGALALGGLTLGDLYRLQAQTPAAGRPRQKSAIMIFLSGGPSHLDMYDMKPEAPVEYRGEFNPIRTNVPGIDICELMPMQAQIADKFTILRGCQLAHLHTANEFYSGFPWQESPRASVPDEARRPALGSVLGRVRPSGTAMPPYVSLNNQPDWERAYYLGVEYEPFRVDAGNPREALENMGRHKEVSVERLGNRNELLHAFDTLRRDLDTRGTAKGIDAFQSRAIEMVASGKVRDAFDIEKEPGEIRARYGEGKFNHGQHPGRMLLQARRLVEAGVSVVTACVYGWDTHRTNFATLRELVPPLDYALHGLVTDLDERGLLQDVAVILGGEFGRTPRIGDITPDGRSHWPDAGFLWMAGGGLQTGQVIGATDARGERIIGNPIR